MCMFAYMCGYVCLLPCFGIYLTNNQGELGTQPDVALKEISQPFSLSISLSLSLYLFLANVSNSRFNTRPAKMSNLLGPTATRCVCVTNAKTVVDSFENFPTHTHKETHTPTHTGGQSECCMSCN